MNLGNLILRRSFAGALAALMLMLSVSLPVLEEAEAGHEPVVESEHSPADCPPAHNHTICTQVGANQAAPTSASEQPLEQQIVQVVTATSLVLAARSAVAEGHPSRAPPKV
jgi:hypothetical protein